MSKKKSRKKHQFKYTSSQAGVVSAPEVGSGEPVNRAVAIPRKSQANAALAGVDNFDYVAGDVKRVAMLAAGFITLQVFLWYLFGHTTLGSTIYGLVKL